MPWQRLVADVGGELLDNGAPAFREVWFTVPRQSGKTTLVLSWEADRCLSWPKPQRVIYSAQNGNEAAKKLTTEQGPLLRNSKLAPALEQLYKGAGNEAVVWHNGSRIDILRDSESAGHGKTLDLAVIDEAFADIDDRREQALIPAMATRWDAQILGCSTAGTDASVYLRRKFAAGRAAAERGDTTGIAFFEWSADDGADADDPATWWSCMPALGHTITEAVVRHARQTMTDGEFRRAFLNQWTSTEDRVIPLDAWESACAGDHAVAEQRMVYAVEATPERSHAAVGVSDGVTVELVEHRAGVGWAADRIAEMVARRRAPVAIDPAGPAGYLVGELVRRGVNVVEVGGREVAQACASFFDAVNDGALHVRRHPSLDSAAASASKRSAGDAWVWARRNSSGDVSPLFAVTLARHAATSHVAPAPGLLSLADFLTDDDDDDEDW
jgi:hypothetical protein